MNEPSFIEVLIQRFWMRLALLLPKRLIFYVGLRMWSELLKNDVSEADWEKIPFADVINLWIV